MMDSEVKVKDNVMPGDRWKFDDEVTEVFDDMLARSIPQYEVMRDLCFSVSRKFRLPKTDIVDLGCSRGEAIARLIDEYGAQNRFIGVEVSKPMVEACQARFKGLIDASIVDIRNMDLRLGYPPVRASVTLCVLALQFIPIEYRQRVLRDAYKHTLPGGGFILVEKVLGGTSELDKVLVDEYHQMKADNGYTWEQIERKKYSLEGVLVPVTAKWNEELLHMAGFSHVECFWRWMNFAAWVAVREAP